MYQYKDLFYSFNLDELEGFEEIKKEHSKLSTFPPEYSPEAVYRFIGQEKHLEIRKTLVGVPDFQKALEREAKMNLSKRVNELKKSKKKEDELKSTEFGLRPGHICFNHQLGRVEKLRSDMSKLFDHNCLVAGDFLYPPNGFRMWHTNKFDVESWFAFLVDVDKPKQSFFKFIDNETKEIITHLDTPTTVNIFRIGKSDLFWHCIGTNNCHRWSQGFSLPNNWKEKIGL